MNPRDILNPSSSLARVASLTLVVWSMGCDSGPQSSPLAPEHVPLEVAAATCEKLFTCCSPAQRTSLGFVGSDQSICEVNLGVGIAAFPQIIQSIKKGRLLYDAAKAASCVSKYKAQSCADTDMHFTPDQNCEYLTPQVAVGGACATSLECIKGFCGFKAQTDEEGTCVAEFANGTACQGDAQCGSGFCDSTSKTCAPEPPFTGGFCG